MTIKHIISGLLFSLLIFQGSEEGFTATSEHGKPLEVIFVATSYTGPAKSTSPKKPALIDRAVSLLNGQIKPNYILTSVTRGWQLLKTTNNVCVAEKLRLPEREHLGYFSSYPLHIYPPHRLQTNPKIAQRLQGYTSLEEMLAETDIVIGITRTINYGHKIMPLIEKYPAAFYSLNSANNHEEMLDTMVLAGRIDANFRASHNEWPIQKKLVPISISESSTPLKGHLLCSKSTIGKEVVKLLDQIMTSQSYKDFMLQAHLKAFPESEHNFIREQMRLIFSEGLRN